MKESKKYKIAICKHNNNVALRFDCCKGYLTLQILDDAVVSKTQCYFCPNVHPCKKIDQLVNENVDLLICGGIQNIFRSLLEYHRIDVILDVYGDVDEVIDSYLSGNLKAMSGRCCGCRRRRRHRRGRS